ncbi:MAG: hypothetical protein ACFFCW_21880 [Candidatus Hodarchaeota archaeon]
MQVRMGNFLYLIKGLRLYRENEVLVRLIEALENISGLDVHKKIVVCTVLIEDQQGQIQKLTHQCIIFFNELRGLAKWLSGLEIETLIMENMGIY